LKYAVVTIGGKRRRKLDDLLGETTIYDASGVTLTPCPETPSQLFYNFLCPLPSLHICGQK